jgi:pterin-4a-carbinolamine dehydratase
MKNVSQLMGDYFHETPRFSLNEELGRSLPISPKQEKWTKIENPESISRVFSLSNTQNLIFFLEDLIQMQDSMGHHGKMLVDKNKVLCQISTRGLDRVTELDIEWAAKVDDIYDNIESAK